jgi:hypothetical protein
LTEQEPLSIDVRTPLGIAIIVQVLSGILIVGGSAYFGPPITDILWVIFAAVLYVIGFIQIIVTRNVLQREKNAILVANFVAVLVVLFSFAEAMTWGVLLDHWIPSIFYALVFGINLANGAVLYKQRSLMSS